jgi:hypothetical protein
LSCHAAGMHDSAPQDQGQFQGAHFLLPSGLNEDPQIIQIGLAFASLEIICGDKAEFAAVRPGRHRAFF